MKIVNLKPVVADKSLGGITIGTVFAGTIGIYASVFLRAYEVVVDLQDPNQTWEVSEEYQLTVKNYQPLEAELHVR